MSIQLPPVPVAKLSLPLREGAGSQTKPSFRRCGCQALGHSNRKTTSAPALPACILSPGSQPCATCAGSGARTEVMAMLRVRVSARITDMPLWQPLLFPAVLPFPIPCMEESMQDVFMTLAQLLTSLCSSNSTRTSLHVFSQSSE